MGSVYRPPPVYHAATFSALTDEPVEETTLRTHVISARDQEELRPQNIRTGVHDGWVMARKSRIPSRAWNRQSILVFADFNVFESPRGSRSQRIAERDDEDLEDYLGDTSSRPEYVTSSASSLYSLDKALPEPPYHVFTLAKKKQLVYIVSLAGLFSPLSSNIYFPALGQIATVRLNINLMCSNSPTCFRISKSAYHLSVLLSQYTWLSRGLPHLSGGLYQTLKGGASHLSVRYFIIVPGIELT